MGLKLIGEVALDGSGFERGLAQIGSSAASHMKGFVASAFGLYGIEEAIRKTAERAEELVDTSRRLGIGVEQLQVLRQAAKDNGTELETLTKAFEKLDQAREKALNGSIEGQKLLGRFQQLGISQEDLQRRTAAELLMGPMREKAASMNPEDLVPILRDILGKAAGQLIPVLGTDFDELAEKMRSIGALMDTEMAVKLDALGDEFSLLSQIITSQLAPALIAFTEWLYRKLLEAGKTVAGAAGYLGGGAAAEGGSWLKQGGRAWAELNASIVLGAIEMVNRELADTWQEEFDKQIGFNTEAAAQGAREAERPWEDKLRQLEALLAKLAEDANKLDHPTPPGFDPADASPIKKVKQLADKGDALTRVGNFLGASRDVLGEIAQQQLQVQRQTLSVIQEMNNKIGTDGSGTLFPPA